VEITVLGAGVTTPTPTRFGSSHAVSVGGDTLLFDCGPATTYRLAKAGINVADVDHLFFTHHHYDHDADFACFVLCRWDISAGRKPLRVFGPQPTKEISERLLGGAGPYAFDLRARLNHPASLRKYQSRGGVLPRRPPELDVVDAVPGVVCSGDGWSVTAAVAQHAQPWLDSLAYRIDSTEGSVVMTGDTEPCRSVVDLARDADVLVCECQEEEALMIADGVAEGSSGPTRAAEMARDAAVRKLVLVHVGPRLAGRAPMEKALRDIKAIFSGEVIVGEELLKVAV
jgi:ribonuclease Z